MKKLPSKLVFVLAGVFVFCFFTQNTHIAHAQIAPNSIPVADWLSKLTKGVANTYPSTNDLQLLPGGSSNWHFLGTKTEYGVVNNTIVGQRDWNLYVNPTTGKFWRILFMNWHRFGSGPAANPAPANWQSFAIYISADQNAIDSLGIASNGFYTKQSVTWDGFYLRNTALYEQGVANNIITKDGSRVDMVALLKSLEGNATNPNPVVQQLPDSEISNEPPVSEQQDILSQVVANYNKALQGQPVYPSGCTSIYGYDRGTGLPCSGTNTAIDQPGGNASTGATGSTGATSGTGSVYNPYGGGASNTNNSGSASGSDVINRSSTVDLKANGSNGPISVGLGTPVTLSWVVSGQTSCYKSSNPPSEFTGLLTPLNNGSLIAYTPLGTIQYKISCGPFADVVSVNTSSDAIVGDNSQNNFSGSSGFAKFAIGAQVMTTANLNARSSSNLSASANGVVPTGTNGTVTAGPVSDGGNNWYQVSYANGMSGWSVETFLTLVTGTVVALSPVSNPPAGLSNSGAVLPSGKFYIGEAVKTTTSNLNIRSTANGTIVGTQPIGIEGIIDAGPQTAGGTTWWHINYDTTLVDGWTAENFLAQATDSLVFPTTAKLPPYRLMDRFHLAMHDDIFGWAVGQAESGASGIQYVVSNPGRFDVWTNTSKYENGALTEQQVLGVDFLRRQVFIAAATAGIVPLTPEGMETLETFIGESYANGLSVAGDTQWKEFWRWYSLFVSSGRYDGTNWYPARTDGVKNVNGQIYYMGSAPDNYKSYTTDANGVHTLILNNGSKFTWGNGVGGTNPNSSLVPTRTGKVIIDAILLHKTDPAPYPALALRQQNIMSDGSIVSGGYTAWPVYVTPQAVQALYQDSINANGSTVQTRFYTDLSVAEKADIMSQLGGLYQGFPIRDPETSVAGPNGTWIDKCSATITTHCLMGTSYSWTIVP